MNPPETADYSETPANGINVKTTFTYDKRNLLATLVDGTGTSTYSYDANGNRTGLTLSNGVVTTTAFDAANRVTQLKNEDGSSNNIYTTDYRMDKVGNRLKITETRPTATRNLVYTYDPVYRLTSEDDNGVVTTYTYDDAGNRLTKSDGTNIWIYEVDQLNRVAEIKKDGTTDTTYTYDANGNRETKVVGNATDNYGYDRENRLVSVITNYDYSNLPPGTPPPGGGIVNKLIAVYDYRTRRMKTNEYVDTKYYVYDGGVNVQELDSARSLTKQLVRGTGMGGGIGSVLYTEGSSGNNRSFFCYNAIGSVVALTDSTGAITSTTSYEAFGKEVTSTGSTSENRKFCTKERDTYTGLDNFGFRYYDWELGRFITRDPSGYPDGPNNYLYCHNNPINHIDPLGLDDGKEEDDTERYNRESERQKLNKEIKQAKKSHAERNKTKDGKPRTKVDIMKHNLDKGYDSPTDAAMDAADYILQSTVNTGNEYAGRLYKDKDGQYRFTSPQEGSPKTSQAGSIPKGTEDAGIYHSHPNAKNSEKFSRGSSGPWGSGDMKMVNPDIGGDAPKDAKHSRNYMISAKSGKLRVYDSGIHRNDDRGTTVAEYQVPTATGSRSDISRGLYWKQYQRRSFIKKFDIGRKGRIYPEYHTKRGMYRQEPVRNRGIFAIEEKTVYPQP